MTFPWIHPSRLSAGSRTAEQYIRKRQRLLPTLFLQCIFSIKMASQEMDLDTSDRSLDDSVEVSESIRDGGSVMHVEERKALAEKEARAVNYIRVVAGLVLAMVAGLAMFGVYRFISKDQKEDFEKSFAANDEKLLENFHLSVERQMEALDSLSVSMTSFAAATGEKWPNVS